METAVTAVLFGVELDLITENLGPVAAVEVVKSLGEYINKNLDALGGFSARQSRDQILTILPHIEIGEADQLLNNFARELQELALSEIRVSAQAEIKTEACFEIYIYAGITEARANEAIEDIIRKAKSNQKVIATYRCEVRR